MLPGFKRSALGPEPHPEAIAMPDGTDEQDHHIRCQGDDPRGKRTGSEPAELILDDLTGAATRIGAEHELSRDVRKQRQHEKAHAKGYSEDHGFTSR